MTVRLVSDERGVATITFSRPEVKNALDGDLISEFISRLDELSPDAPCVVIRSEGDVFCAGADLNWMRGMLDHTYEENIADSRTLAALFARLDDLPMPVIVGVQGAAIGGGAGLVAVCDIAVASTSAVLAFSEVRVGIIPSVISPYVVRRCGQSFTTASFVSGVPIDAVTAIRVGLVDAIVEPDALDGAVEEFVAAILAGSPSAVREAKRLVKDVAGRSPSEVRELTIERIAKARISPDGQEGMRAFVERRKPNWTA